MAELIDDDWQSDSLESDEEEDNIEWLPRKQSGRQRQTKEDPEQCLLACKEGRQKETIRLLRQIKDPFSIKDENGATIAHYAARHGWFDFLKDIDENFAVKQRGHQATNDRVLDYLQQEDNNGKTPLVYASESKQLKVMGLLAFAQGANLDNCHRSGRPGRPEDILDALVNVAPSVVRQCMPAAGPLASILPSIITGKKCDDCQEMHEQVCQKNEQVEILAKHCMDKEREKTKLQKKLTQLQVSDLPDMMEATADIQMQWREMGVALGISTTVLDDISSLEPFDELRCLYEMLHHWVLDIGATWGGLVGAMRSSNVKQKDIAKHLELKHIHGGGLSDGHGSLQVQTIVKDEKPITESQVSTVVEAVFHSVEDIHIDWKVLGLMLGLNDSTLDTIQSADDHNYEKAMLKHWIETGKAYWSVLIDVIAGHVIDERQIARTIAKAFLNLDLYLPIILEDDIYVSEGSIEKMAVRIASTFSTNKEAVGMVFIIGMGDSAGTDKDGENIATVLRQLKFVVFRMENSSREELSCLVKTVAMGKCPLLCKKIIFYYAGHGGIDKHGHSFMRVNDGNEGKFFINVNMIAHFNKNKVKKNRNCLFFLDCCLSGELNHGYELTLPVVPIRCLIAFATSMGHKSYGDKYAGGVWTRHLCSHLKEKRSVSDILDSTYTDEQPSIHLSCAGAVFLNGAPNYFDGDSSDDELDPGKIWDRHSKELVEQLGYSNTLIALTSGLCIEHVIDKETKNAIMSASNGGGDILVKAVKEKIDGPETLHLVLDVMDQRDELCGLVRTMRRELGILEDKPKNVLKDHHDEILELLHTAATDNTIVSLCGGLSSKRLIDGKTFYDVTSEKCTLGPNKLLKCLEEKVDKEPTMIISIIDIMGEEEVLEEVVEKMKEALKLQQLHSPPTAKLPAKFLRPQQVIEQLAKDNSQLEEENIQLRKRECYQVIKVPLVVFFVTLSMYFVIRKFR